MGGLSTPLSGAGWFLSSSTAIIGIIFVIAGGFFGDKIYKAYFLPGQMIPNMTFSAVGKDGWEFFKKYDRDGDIIIEYHFSQ
jgi:hypothetical protein